MADVRDFAELKVYVASRDAAMRIFSLSRAFPPEERHSLTSQIRRSSRSVCANIAEGWPKRRYPNAFRAKLLDAAGEADETRSWVDIAGRCGFLSPTASAELTAAYHGIAGRLIRMSADPEAWRIR